MVVVLGADRRRRACSRQLGNGLGVFHIDRTVAFDNDGLALLGAENGAHAGTCGVVTGVDDVGVRELIRRRAVVATSAVWKPQGVQRLGCSAGAERPHNAVGRFNGDIASMILTKTGLSDWPSMHQAHPSLQASASHRTCRPLRVDDQMIPVNVDRWASVVRPARGTPEAVSGPTAKMTLLSGESRLVPAGTSSYMILLPCPYRRCIACMLVDFVEMTPVLRFDAGDFAGPTERNVVFFCHCNSPSFFLKRST